MNEKEWDQASDNLRKDSYFRLEKRTATMNDNGSEGAFGKWYARERVNSQSSFVDLANRAWDAGIAWHNDRLKEGIAQSKSTPPKGPVYENKPAPYSPAMCPHGVKWGFGDCAECDAKLVPQRGAKEDV